MADEGYRPTASAAENYLNVLAAAKKYLQNAGRSDGLKILPVSKGHTVKELTLELADPRLPREWGESYEQELLEKAKSLEGVRWHFLGRLQSKKIPKLCQVAAVLHTVSRIKELEIMAVQSQVPEFFIQVNISNEAQKSGCEAAELASLLVCVQKLDLEKQFLGLMGMAAPLEKAGEATVRAQFRSLKNLRDQLCPGKALNMGMSDDFKIAIEEGTHLVRIGSAIFGERSLV